MHYVVLNDVFWHGAGYIGYVGDRQLAWLAADLITVEPGAPVVVLLHIPPLSTLSVRAGEQSPSVSQSVANREALYRVLEPYDAYLLSGHMHELEHQLRGYPRGVMSRRTGFDPWSVSLHSGPDKPAVNG